MEFKFDFPRTLAAAAELLRKEPDKKMSWLRLIKLLYIADREALKETGYPMTGDTIVAMKNGPVLSHLYDIIKGNAPESAEFSKFIQKTDEKRLVLTNDPGIGKLCKFDLQKLKELSQRYRDNDDWEIVEQTHEFPEWIKNNFENSVRPIPLEDILTAVGFDEERIAGVKQNAQFQREIDQIFGTA